jgi:hypothetical protein
VEWVMPILSSLPCKSLGRGVWILAGGKASVHGGQRYRTLGVPGSLISRGTRSEVSRWYAINSGHCGADQP